MSYMRQVEHPVHVDDTMADVRYSHNLVDMRVGLVIISYYTVPLSVNDEPKETGVVHQSTGGVFVSDTTIRENRIQVMFCLSPLTECFWRFFFSACISSRYT
jgi:hypothetical protein